MTLKHTFVSPVTDLGNPNEVGPDEWNDNHYLSGNVPASNSATGTQGDLAFGSDGALYLCYQENMWAKFTGSTSFTNGSTFALLLRDGASFLLLRDGASHLLLGH